MWVLSELFQGFQFSFQFLFIYCFNQLDIQNKNPAGPSNAAEVKTCSEVKVEWLETAAGTEKTWEPIFKQV